MRGLKALLAVPVLTAGCWVVMPVAQAAADDITKCPGRLDTPTSTYTLTADCPATIANFGLSVEPGFTVDGAGHTISVDTNFQGAVISNRTGGPITLRNLKVQGANLVRSDCALLFGVLLTNTDATITNVEVNGMVRPAAATAGCQTGLGMRVLSDDATPHTVNVSGFKTSNFQKAGLVASGTVTVNVSDSTIGPPALLTGQIAQNAVQYGGLVPHGGGTFSHNTVIGAGSGRTDAGSTAMLLFGANDVLISDNTITGAGTDTGIDVEAAGLIPSTNVKIENNHIERTSALPVAPTPSGEGIFVDALSLATTTVICNTFSGWITNLSGVTQPPCITTNANLPNGRLGSPYSTELAATSQPPGAVTWAVTVGALPPGLTLAADGTITGTPTTVGTFSFTATVTDAAA